MENKFLKNNSGQTLYYFLIFIIILIISWAMMLNIACLIRKRMQMQNEADCIALSLATYKARVLNFLGKTNYMIGTILSLGTNPRIIQLSSYSTDKVGGWPAIMTLTFENPMSDLLHDTVNVKRNTGVEKIKQIVELLQKAQGISIKCYLAYYYSTLINQKYNVFLLPVNPDKNLGLKRNSKGIQYYSTRNYCFYIDPTTHFHFLVRSKYKKDKYSWLIEGSKFHDQKIKVILRQTRTTKQPLFANFLNIHYPEIIVYSAASPYNIKGSMFPKKEDCFTGATKLTSTLVEASSAMQLALMAKALAQPAAFPPAAPFVALAEAGLLINYAESKRESLKLLQNKDNPIDAYLSAKNGGWAAHIVPYNEVAAAD
ncbi:MAG: hypothetical protein LBF23_02930 [Endomicrobium sp.]|nr:hypothetical protein [Endomicrobium sp.]